MNNSSDHKSQMNGKLLDVVKIFCKPYLNSDNCARIPEYTAVEESRNVWNFQCITLPDGKSREIDMKVFGLVIFNPRINSQNTFLILIQVIEPYNRIM